MGYTMDNWIILYNKDYIKQETEAYVVMRREEKVLDFLSIYKLQHLESVDTIQVFISITQPKNRVKSKKNDI